MEETIYINDSDEIEEGEITSDDMDIGEIGSTSGQEFSWSDLDVLMVGDERILSFCWSELEGFPKQDLFYVTGGNTRSMCSVVDKQIQENHDIVIIFGFHYDLCFYELGHGKQMKLRERKNFVNIVDTVKEYSAKWKKKYPKKYFIWGMPYPVDFYNHNRHLRLSKGLFNDTEQIHLTELYCSQVELLFNEINKADISDSFIFNINKVACFKHIFYNLSEYLTNGLFPKKDVCLLLAYYFVEFLYSSVFPSKNKYNINFNVAKRKLMCLKDNYHSQLDSQFKLKAHCNNDSFDDISLSDETLSNHSFSNLISVNYDSISLSDMSSISSDKNSGHSVSYSQQYRKISLTEKPQKTLDKYDLSKNLGKASKSSSDKKRKHNNKRPEGSRVTSSKSKRTHNYGSKSRSHRQLSKSPEVKLLVGPRLRSKSSRSSSRGSNIFRPKSPSGLERRKRDSRRHRKEFSTSKSSNHEHISRSKKLRHSSTSSHKSSSSKRDTPISKNKIDKKISTGKLRNPDMKSAIDESSAMKHIEEINEPSNVPFATESLLEQQIDTKKEYSAANKDEEIQFWKALKRLKEVHDMECEVFRKNPISHPTYAREKIKFFDDYYIAKSTKSKPWDEYWVTRMEELFQEKWNSNKIQLSLECSKLIKRNITDDIEQNLNSQPLKFSGTNNAIQLKSESNNVLTVKTEETERTIKQSYSNCLFNNDTASCSLVDRENSTESVLHENNIDEEIDFDIIMDDPMFKQGLDDIDIAIKTVFKEKTSSDYSEVSCIEVDNKLVKSESFPLTDGCVLNNQTTNTCTEKIDQKNSGDRYKHGNKKLTSEFLYIMKMLYRMSKQLGPLGHSISEIYANAKTSYDSSNNALAALDSDAKIVLELVEKKMKHFLNNELSTIHKAIYGEIHERLVNFLIDLKFHSTKFPKVDIKNISVSVKDKDVASAIELIKNTLLYNGYFDFSGHDLMNIYRSVQNY